jgi:pyruvate carboxylase
MFAAVASIGAGTLSEICVKISESVESKDLLVRLVK